MPPPDIEHVPLHSNSLWKKIARASSGVNNMHPISWGAQTEKIQLLFPSTWVNYQFIYISFIFELLFLTRRMICDA